MEVIQNSPLFAVSQDGLEAGSERGRGRTFEPQSKDRHKRAAAPGRRRRVGTCRTVAISDSPKAPVSIGCSTAISPCSSLGEFHRMCARNATWDLPLCKGGWPEMSKGIGMAER